MNYKLAIQEFTAFRDDVQRISFAFPLNDTRIDSAYDKCQSLLNTLFKLQTHPFGVQLAGLKVKNVGAKSLDKVSRLKLLVDNIIDDIKLREKSGPTTSPWKTLHQNN